MNRNNIYIILFFICVITVVISYYQINSELENTVLTSTNTKTQPCPDYWKYDSTSNLCYDPDDNAVDFSDFTFCDKQQYSKNIDNPIPWNGISNVVNPRCDKVVVPRNDNTPEPSEYDFQYIYYVYFYSLLIMLIVVLELVFNKKGNRGRIFMIFFLCILVELVMYYILGIDLQSMFFGKRYSGKPNPHDENRNKCYNWSCLL